MPHRFYAVVIPGLEAVAADELESLSAHDISVGEGGVSFSGTMETMFRANLRSRTITRILLRLKRFTVMSLDELQHHIGQIDWANYLTAESSIAVQASCHSSRLIHSGKVEEAVAVALKRNGQGTWPGEHVQNIHVRIENNRCRISIDTSGDRLDRRGYRLEGGKAPVRESVASALLVWMQWRPEEPLLVPMCGSGTFAIEAALMAMKKAPGLSHDFSFLHWPGLKTKAWQRAFDKAEAMAASGIRPSLIDASDINASALAIASRNAERAGVEMEIAFAQKDARMLKRPDTDAGVLMFNPPYGRRIDADVVRLYGEIGSLCREEFKGWRALILSPDLACESALGLPVERRIRIRHGGGWITALHV